MSAFLGAVLQGWLEEFLEDIRRRGYSPASYKVYRSDLSLFAKWAADQAELASAGDLTAAALEKYQIHLMLRATLQKRKSQPRTLSTCARNRSLAALRCFFRYLKKTCKLLSNPALELERAREPKRLPKVILTVPEVARLLEVIPKDSPTGLRDWVAVELLYGTAVRRGELLGLALSSLRLSEGLVHVMGKGSKERVIPLGKAAKRAVLEYLRRGRPQLAKGEHSALLVSCHHGGPVSENELIEAIRKHARQAQIKKRIRFHLFRHTAATHLLRGGADLRSLQALLGHTELNTTAVYTRVEVSDLQRIIQRFHPREQE